MTANSSVCNPPPYSADTSLYVFLENSEGRLLPNHRFYQLVDETRRGFLHDNDILEYMANSTFADNPTPESQLTRMDEIRDLVRNNCPVIVGSKSAAIGGGLLHDGPNVAEKVAGREHIYLDQDLINQWLSKKSPNGRWLLLTFLLKVILLREFTIISWLTYGIRKSDSIHGNGRCSTPFTQPTDFFVSGCGHLFIIFKSAKDRKVRSILFLNDEGGYLEVPAVNTSVLRRLAAGDWSVFQRDVITSMGPYRKYTKHQRLERVWDVSECTCFGK
ncbi:hypothetical protein C8R48DRAFT_309524 [Suillus tomentosus]|nr:hypothetical protein C8R48DRAFT_309524 [Suillus tomentosus]